MCRAPGEDGGDALARPAPRRGEVDHHKRAGARACGVSRGGSERGQGEMLLTPFAIRRFVREVVQSVRRRALGVILWGLSSFAMALSLQVRR